MVWTARHEWKNIAVKFQTKKDALAFSEKFLKAHGIYLQVKKVENFIIPHSI